MVGLLANMAKGTVDGTSRPWQTLHSHLLGTPEKRMTPVATD